MQINNLIGKLDNKQCNHGEEHLATIPHAYNASHSQITGYSPYFLIMGCRLRLPVNLLFPTSGQLPKTRSVNEYVNALHGSLRDTREHPESGGAVITRSLPSRAPMQFGKFQRS